MPTDFVRVCDLPDLQVGDLLYVERSEGQKRPLYILPPRSVSDGRLRGFYVHVARDRNDLRSGVPGWPIHEGGANAMRSVKVRQRLRGVSREDVTERWDATLARLLAAPEASAALKFGDPVTAEDWRTLPPGSIVDTHDGSPSPFKHKLVTGRWVWALNGEPKWSAQGGYEHSSEYDRTTYVGHVTPGTTGEAWDRALLGPAGLTNKVPSEATTKPLAVGDKVQSVADLRALPVGTVIQRPSGVWHRASTSRNGWRPVCLADSPGGSWPSLGRPDVELEDLQEARIIALNVVTEDRVVFARALAEQGYKPAADALAACPPPVKGPQVGDRVEVDDYDHLPAGTVVETEEGQEKLAGSHLILKKDGWQAVLDPGATKDLDARFGRVHEWSIPTTTPPFSFVALDANLAGTRGDFYKSLAEQGHEPSRAVMWAPAHPKIVEAPSTPKIGDMLTPEQVAALPAGAVVETDTATADDPTWVWHVAAPGLGRSVRLCGGNIERKLLGAEAFRVRGRLVALDTPTGDDRRALYEALASSGYEPARLALEGANKDVEKDLDGTPAMVQTEDMATNMSNVDSVEFPALGLVCRRMKGETDTDFQARASRLCDAAMAKPSAREPLPPATQEATPGTTAMQRLGASLKATGAGLASQAFDRAKVNAARVGIDAAKAGAHKAVVAIAEAIGGEKAAISALRVVQMSQVQVVEDYAISFIADMAGRPALAAVARERAVERTVDGTFDFALSQVAKAGAQVLGALTSADEAATSAQAQVAEGEVMS